MKKIFSLILAMLFFMTPAQAQTSYTVDDEEVASELTGTNAEKFYASLPQATGDYKSRQRPILLEGAMNTETEVLVRALKNPVVYRELNYLFVAGTYKDYPVVVVRTEQGLANAAASTALAIKKFNPVAVINQGTSGGTTPALKIGDIVIGDKAIPTSAYKSSYSPKGAGVDFTAQKMRGTYAFDAATKTFQPNSEYPADPTLFNVAFAVANEHENFNAVSGTIGTADWWMCWVDYMDMLNKRYGMLCEEMETVAAAQICHNAGVPFIGIRILSDNITIGQEYDPAIAVPVQNFVLLVTERYIRTVLNK